MWPSKTEHHQIVARDTPLTPTRVASVFADSGAGGERYVDDGQTQILDKHRDEVALEAGTEDGVVYYEQVQAPTCWIKLGE